MPSTYTTNNGIELIGTGEQSSTWGDTTNTNLSLIDAALDGQVTVTLASAGTSGSPNTLPISDGAASNGRNRLVIFTDGADLGADAYVQLTPDDAEKIVYVRNSLSGSRSIILFQGTYNASNDYEVPAGTTAVVYFDGAGAGAVAANVFNNAYFDSLRLGSVSVTAILDEDNMASDSDTALATQQSIKAYVDAQVTAQDLDFAGDSGTGAVDLDSQTFTIAGTANEIETSASGQTITVGLPNAVTITSLTATSADINGGTIDGVTIGGASAGAGTFTTLNASSGTITGDLTVDTNTLYVDSADNRVGIGTTAPDTKLTVSAGTGDGIFVEDNNASNTSPFVEVRGKRGDANASQTFAGKLLLDGHRTDAAVGVNKHLGTVAFGGNHTDGSDANILYPASISGVAEGTFSNATTMPTSLVFYAGSTGRSESTANVTFGDEAMRITSGGNVGIGTTNPVTTLDVAGNARISNIIFTEGEDLTISADNNNSAAASTVNILVDGTEVADFTHSGYLRFNKADFASGGICTQSLDSTLNLAGGANPANSGLNIAISGPDHTAGTAGLLMRDGTATVYNYQRSVDAHLWYTGGSERMRVTTAGNVGIGTSSPSALLDVAGDAEINDLTVGRGAGDISTNTALGYQALNVNTTGNSNTALGFQALSANTTGFSNVALGHQALLSNTTGDNHIAIGDQALESNTTGNSNTAVGLQALESNTTGNANVAVGPLALQFNTTGFDNTAVGILALQFNTTGLKHTAVGRQALEANTTGSSNTALGFQALQSNTTGSNNIAVGLQALQLNTEGINNTAVGLQALNANTTGDANTTVGVQAGNVITTGNRNTILGYFCDPSAAGGNDQVVVGNNLTGKGNDTAFIGGTNGAYNEKNVTTWETTSDQRIKKNIKDNTDGLNVISQVRVRNFEYRAPDEITELPSHAAIEQDGTQIGVIAQEIQQVLPECVSENSTGVLSVNTDPLVWYLINAVKELKAEIEELKGN